MLLGGLALGVLIGWAAFILDLGSQTQETSTPAARQFATLATPLESGRAPSIGEPAPDFELEVLDGDDVRLSDYAGRPVLINFWASWCEPCKLETAELIRIYEAHRADGLAVLGINLTMTDSVASVRAFAEQLEVTYPILLDRDGEVSRRLYRVPGIPMTVLVDRGGIIADIRVGPMSGDELDAAVRDLLA